MNEKKLLDKIEAKINKYEKLRETKEVGSVAWEIIGVQMLELREVYIDICDWAIDERIGNMTLLADQFMRED